MGLQIESISISDAVTITVEPIVSASRDGTTTFLTPIVISATPITYPNGSALQVTRDFTYDGNNIP